MMALARKTLIHLVGWSFILLGIVGLFLPILQGVLFLLIGLLVLSKESKWAKDILHRIEKRYPVQYQKMHEFKEQLKKRFLRFIQN
ncbi:MAG TPA: PGPGW domain-containing protein [Nitrospiria bacterium]|nr:PGPGW domain-containing protein [Nitrospiria bacterium]